MTINAQKLTEEFVELTSIDRESYNEREMADVLIKRLSDMGFEVAEDNAGELIGGNAGNIYGFLKGNLPGEPILFSAHMDTVPPGNGKKAIVDGDIIKSDGTTVLGGDDLAGILPIIYGIQELIDSGEPRRDVELIFTVAEEVFTKGAKAFDYDRVHAKDAYVLDVVGELGEAAVRAPSIMHYKATIKGRASHAGSASEKGINAIACMCQAVSLMKQGRPNAESTFNVGTISGGIASNIVSEECSIVFEARSLTNEGCQSVINDNLDILQRCANDYGAELIIEPLITVHALNADSQGSVVKNYYKACEAIGVSPVLKTAFGASDGNHFAHVGINTLIISTGMTNIHSTKEYCYISRMVKNAELIAEILKQQG